MNVQKQAESLELAEMTRARELARAVEEEQAHKAAEVLAAAAEDAGLDSLVTSTDTLVTTDGHNRQADGGASGLFRSEQSGTSAVSVEDREICEFQSGKSRRQEGTTIFGQAAKSDNGDVIVIQPSDEMVQQILGQPVRTCSSPSIPNCRVAFARRMH